MGLILLLAAVLLCLFIALAVYAIRYYMGPYALMTKRDFLATLRDPHDWTCYRAASRLKKMYGNDAHLLFDVVIPCDDASAASADVVVLTPRGIAVLCVLGGRGKVYGAADGEPWVLVQAADNDSASMVPNVGMQAADASVAVRHYLMLEDVAATAVVPQAVLGTRVHDAGAEVPQGVLVTGVRKVAQALEGKLASTEPDVFESDQIKRMYRALKACAGAKRQAGVLVGSQAQVDDNGGVGAGADPGAGSGGITGVSGAGDGIATGADSADDSGVVGAAGGVRSAANAGAVASDSRKNASKSDPTAWLRSVVQRGREESTSAELVRKADKLASSKEDFDALTWDRIMEISAELDREHDPERVAELAAELRLIARTNVSLNYRFGIAQASEGAALSPAGLVMESSVGELTETPPDPELREALENAEDSGFFDNSINGDSSVPAGKDGDPGASTAKESVESETASRAENASGKAIS